MSGPPTQADRERASTDVVKRAQQMHLDGFIARQSEEPPELPKPEGSKRPAKRDMYASLAHKAEERCPKTEFVVDAHGSELRNFSGMEQRGRTAPIPAQDRETWKGGYLLADSIAVVKGHAYLASMNPTRPRRTKAEAVAEPVAMFPEEVLTRQEVRRRKGTGATDALRSG